MSLYLFLLSLAGSSAAEIFSFVFLSIPNAFILSNSSTISSCVLYIPVSLIGFTTYSGEVIAAKEWDGKTEIMSVPMAQSGSFEDLLHEGATYAESKQYYINSKDFKDEKLFQDYIGHRAIGVVYHPQFERRGNYVPSMVTKRYDAVVFFDATHALNPLPVKFDYEKIPETYPFGDRI